MLSYLVTIIAEKVYFWFSCTEKVYVTVEEEKTKDRQREKEKAENIELRRSVELLSVSYDFSMLGLSD